MADPIREEAENVLRDLRMWRLPVKPLEIAREEEIELAPSQYGIGFDARIEYLPLYDGYAIYYQEPGPFRNAGRVNFSLAHELGHFYLPEHRKRLRARKMHNSQSDYCSKDPAEKEADRFAANLLMPEELFIADVHHHYRGYCTLKNIRDMAERLGTSVTSTAIRYCDCGIDATMVIISRDGIVDWSWASEDMKRLTMYWAPAGMPIPEDSKTADLYTAREIGGTDEIVEGSVDSHVWFEWPKRDTLWEEAMFRGNYVLTYLAAPDD
jgi:hypothetical protein